jgi:hypothetical protein
MKNLLLISFSFLLSASCVSTSTTLSAIDKQVFDKEKISRYQLLIKVNQAEITGVMIVKYMNDEWRGSLVNEFGVKAFDFIASAKKCRLKNTIPFLDKWYIRKTIASDLAYLFGKVNRKREVKGKSVEWLSEDAFILKNEKHHIEYLFQPIE